MSPGIQCVSETCEYPIDPSWDFCPACGTDNRIPSQRKRIPQHHHRFLQDSGFCIRCGEPEGEPYSFGYRWRVRLMVGCWMAGAFSLLSAGLIQLGKISTGTIFGDWVASWYYVQVAHRGGRRYHRYTYYNDLGYDWTVGLGIVGIGLVVLGTLMLFKVPLSDDSDDGWIWRRSDWWGRW
jgi:hypothetical protein